MARKPGSLKKEVIGFDQNCFEPLIRLNTNDKIRLFYPFPGAGGLGIHNSTIINSNLVAGFQRFS